MHLNDLKLKNLRGYGEDISISCDGLIALSGKNDTGKPTVLDALNIVHC